jgi:WD40 repeat protein
VRAALIAIAAAVALGIAAQDAAATWSAPRSELTYIVTDSDRPTSGHSQWRVVTTRPDGSAPRVLYACVDNATAAQCRLGFGPATWSPDGRRFGTRGYLFTVGDPDGSGGTMLPAPAAANRTPAWSPNGRRIAIVGFTRDENGPTDVFTVRPDGTGLRRLTYDGRVTDVAWSARGRIAYANGDVTRNGAQPGDGLKSVDANGGSRRVLLAGSKVSNLDWSPDGRRLLFSGVEQAREGLWVTDDRHRPRRLLKGYGALWWPTGHGLLLEDPTGHLFKARTDGTHRRALPRPALPSQWGYRLFQGWRPRP